MKQILITLLNFYQTFLSFDKGVLTLLAPGGVCKYEVSCSEYTKRSIARFGVVEGLKSGLKRIGSCR